METITATPVDVLKRIIAKVNVTPNSPIPGMISAHCRHHHNKLTLNQMVHSQNYTDEHKLEFLSKIEDIFDREAWGELDGKVPNGQVAPPPAVEIKPPAPPAPEPTPAPTPAPTAAAPADDPMAALLAAAAALAAGAKPSDELRVQAAEALAALEAMKPLLGKVRTALTAIAK